jgi:hypothetical protein
MLIVLVFDFEMSKVKDFIIKKIHEYFMTSEHFSLLIKFFFISSSCLDIYLLIGYYLL